jgi:hypothetical protein
MIESLLALALAVAPPPDPVIDSSRAFSACLDKVIRKGLREKLGQARFEKELARTCANDAALFRAVVVADDMASGLDRAKATGNAEKEASDMLDLAKAMYADFRSGRSVPDRSGNDPAPPPR